MYVTTPITFPNFALSDKRLSPSPVDTRITKQIQEAKLRNIWYLLVTLLLPAVTPITSVSDTQLERVPPPRSTLLASSRRAIATHISSVPRSLSHEMVCGLVANVPGRAERGRIQQELLPV